MQFLVQFRSKIFNTLPVKILFSRKTVGKKYLRITSGRWAAVAKSLVAVDFHGPRTMRPFLILVAMKVAVVLRRHFNVVPQINDQRFSRQSEVFGPFLIWQKDAFVTLRAYHCVTTNVTRAKNTAREFFCCNGQTESCVKF